MFRLLRSALLSSSLTVSCCAVVLLPGATRANALDSFTIQAQTVVDTQTLALDTLPGEAQGDLLLFHGNYAAAIIAYQKAWPRSAELWNKTGLAYHHLYALDEAMKDYQMALQLDPHNSEAHNNLGAVYHGKHMFGQAEKEYKRALKYEPNRAVTYCNLGTAYFAENHYKKGIKAYQKAMSIDPKVFEPNREARIEEGTSREVRIATAYNLARVYAGAGRNDEALVALRRALSEGFRDRKRLMSDREFASLRETAEFRQMMVEEKLD